MLLLQEIHNISNYEEQMPLQEEFNVTQAALSKENFPSNQVVPYTSNPNPVPQIDQNMPPAIQQGFSYLQMLEEDDDGMLLMVATQFEKSSTEINSIAKGTSSTVIKKSSLKLPMETAFVSC